MEKPQVLVAHERPVIAQAIARVLAAQGLRVQVRGDGPGVAEALKGGAWDALILDVALPGAALHELIELARAGLALPVKAVILVASVFRRSSYKRKPQRLYGADDYVEVHELGAQLPAKLWRHLAVDPASLPGMVEAEAVLADLQDDAEDAGPAPAGRLAGLLVADLVLHGGDRLADADTLDELRDAFAPELAAARATLHAVLGPVPGEADPIVGALAELLRPPVAPAEDRWS